MFTREWKELLGCKMCTEHEKAAEEGGGGGGRVNVGQKERREGRWSCECWDAACPLR